MSTVRQHLNTDVLGEGIETFPTSISWNSTYEGRMVYIDDIDMYLIGGSAGWKQLEEKPYSEVPQSGLVSEWTMEDVNGTTVTDSAGIYNGTIVGTVFQDTGKVGSSLNFQPTQEQATVYEFASVYIGNNIVDFNLSEFSLSVWCYFQNAGIFECIFSNGRLTDNTNNSGTYIYKDDSDFINVAAWNNGISTYTSGVPVPINTWNHLVISRTSNNLKIYQNNNLIFDDVTVALSYDTTVRVALGAYWYGLDSTWRMSKLDNGIDQARFYNRALSSAEVSQLYNFGSGN